MTVPIAPQKAMDDRIAIIANKLSQAPEFGEKEVPGLNVLLNDYLEEKVDKTSFMRGLLQMFRDSETDNTYQDLRDRCTDDEKARLEEFVGGATLEKECSGFHKGHSMVFRDHIKPLLESTSHFFSQVVANGHGAPTAEMHSNLKFTNWGRTVENTPKYTYVPKSVREIQQIVRFAKQKNMSVRCSGYRHSWSPVFSQNGQILISMLQLDTVSQLPNLEAQTFLPEKAPTELETIELLNEPPREGGKRLVRLGAGCTNERLRRWCVKNNAVTLPLNIIMVEITAGGSNAPICHGAGIKHKTLSDLVRRIEYVDAHGELHTITEKDSDFLRAASGCFGLMGIVTHLTLELDRMSYAELRPEKVPAVKAVPPPADMWSKIPPALRLKTEPSEAEKRQWEKDFEEKANNYYYTEWFWFPYADEVWVNCWNTTSDASGVIDWPNPVGVFKSFVEEFTLNAFQYSTVLNALGHITGVAEAAVTLQSRFAMWSLPRVQPDEKPIKTYVSDALHFQRAIQNIRVRDLEVEMPLVPKKENPAKPDYELVRRAWWDAILKAYEHSKACPQRMPLEMRIMGGSDIIMAPQRGNELGTCSIEILTLQNALSVWQPYAQEVLDKWMSYTDANGKRLKTRPHWAKEWRDEYTVDGKPWFEKLKNEDYKEELVEFRRILTAIGKQHGWTLQDLKERFTNEMFDSLVFEGI